jgi:hypothetical protein
MAAQRVVIASSAVSAVHAFAQIPPGAHCAIRDHCLAVGTSGTPEQIDIDRASNLDEASNEEALFIGWVKSYTKDRTP